MISAVLAGTVATGFVVALAHAAIPVHWLPFVAAGRQQGWSRSRTLAVTAVAGIAHVLATSLIGVLVVILGIGVQGWLESVFPWLAAAILCVFAGWYLWQQLQGKPHSHSLPDSVPATPGGIAAPTASRRSDRAVASGLVAMLMLAPCEAFVPVYLAGAGGGWHSFALLSAVLAIATLAAMLVLVALCWRGMASARAAFIERYEPGLVGLAMLALAALVLWLG